MSTDVGLRCHSVVRLHCRRAGVDARAASAQEPWKVAGGGVDRGDDDLAVEQAHPPYDARVEARHDAPAGEVVTADQSNRLGLHAADFDRLVVVVLDLDIDEAPSREQLEDLLEQRNPLVGEARIEPAPDVMLAQAGERRRGDWQRHTAHTFEVVVVHHDELPGSAQVDVELDAEDPVFADE